MELFTDIIIELRSWLDRLRDSSLSFTEYGYKKNSWPRGERGNIVMQKDTAVELGNPNDESASFILWTGREGTIQHGKTTLIGPDINDIPGKNLPFGKVALLEIKGFTRENCYDRHRELETARHNLNLKGYMMRAVSQYLREWSRVSREAVNNGFSFSVLSSALTDTYSAISFVIAVELLFVTSSPEHVVFLQDIGHRATRPIAAMNKMLNEMTFDCASCDYTDICSEVDALKSMKQSIQKERPHG